MNTVPTRSWLIKAMEAARVDQHLSIRAAARIAGVPTATVQGWLNGRHFPTPALRPQFLRLVEALGLQESVVPELWGGDTAATSPSPYLGLRPYDVEDHGRYFGRDDEADRLAEAIVILAGEPTQTKVLVVVGASGAGKSSLVAAGLVGRHVRTGGRLDSWTASFLSVADLAARQPTGGSELWIIDQLDDQIREDTAPSALGRLAELPPGVVVVVVLRADAFGEASRLLELRDPLTRPFLLAPMGAADVTRIICGPAESAGVTVDPELIALILRDTGIGDSGELPDGFLPLLSNALAAGWERLSGGVFRTSDYLASGGLAHSVAELAEDAYRRVGEEDAENVRGLFLGLVRVDGDTVSRRRVDLSSLTPGHLRVMHVFAAARMLATSDAEVQITHDALILHWPRLRDWIDEDRSRLRGWERLQQAAGAWREQGEPDDLLLPVNRLPVFQSLLEHVDQTPLQQVVRDYLSASERHFASVVDRERGVSRRLRRRARIVMALAAVATVLAVVAATSLEQTRFIQNDAQSRQVAAAAVGLRVADSNVRAQMATVSSVLSDTREGRSSVLDAAAADTPTRWTGAPGATAATTPDGSVIVRGNSVGQLTWWSSRDLVTSPGTTVKAVADGSPLYSLAAATIGQRLIVAAAGVCREVWDITAVARELFHSCPGTTAYAAAISPDGSTIIFGGDEKATVLSVSNMVTEATLATPARAAAFSPTGDLYLGGSGPLTHWHPTGDTYSQVSALPENEPRTSRVQALTVSANGRWLVAGLAAPQALVWDLTSGTEQAAFRDVTTYVNGVSFSSDSQHLAVADSDQKTYVVDTSTWAVSRVVTAPAQVTSVAWADGTRLVSASVDGSLRVWGTWSPLLRRSGRPIYQLASDADGTKWLAAVSGGSAMLWSGTDLRTMPTPAVPAGSRLGSALTLTPDGTRLIVADKAGGVVTWPLGKTGAESATVSPLADGGTFGGITVGPTNDVLVATRYLATTSVVARRTGDTWKAVATIPTPTPQTGAFSADGSLYAVGSGDGNVLVFRMTTPETPQLVATLPTDANPSAIAMSHAGSLLVAGTDLGTVSVWDLTHPASPTLKRIYSDALSPINGVSLTPDDSQLAAASGEGFLWTWRLATDTTAYLSLSGGLGTALDTRYYAHGSILLGAGDNGALRAWPVATATARKNLCHTRGTPLSAEEWSRYMPGVAAQDPCSA